ncbi:MAG: pseudouridine synthase [Desulfobacterales bacterium]|nr:pseudouridine synthase [Desulfobacter sp.]MDP6394733.1 pseudouridine synthase [Desulfobacterales bacterium]MDP6681569.1 pseudouridine synthase [Desulfobacterales bacterium]MDP6806809.1 pseudouridine synthase [Desulfobacterales bacterium]
MPMVRLQKFLSSAGVCSRRQGEEYIKKGYVKVNGEVVIELGTKVDPTRDRIEIDRELIKEAQNRVYIVLNKPEGYVTSCKQPEDKIVLDLIDIPERIFPVGRLDKASTGLLILTNDGLLHHRISHPSHDHEKEYEVVLAKPIPNGALKKMEKGLPMMSTKTRSAKIEKISPTRFRIVLREGKNKQIRRMVRKVGNQVIRLKRIRISNIRLATLAEGQWRYLTEKEKKGLINML